MRLTTAAFLFWASFSVDAGSVFAAEATARSASSAREFRVSWAGGKLSVDVAGAPLWDVLDAVSLATGIEVAGADQLDEIVSARFTQVELLEALKQLLARVNHVIAGDGSEPTSGRGTRVTVLGRGGPFVPRTSAVTAAPFVALVTHAMSRPMKELLPTVADAGHPSRLEALTALVEGGSEDPIVLSVLREALRDADPAFRAYSIQALAARGDAGAMDVLRQLFRTADPSTRVMIVESVAYTQAGTDLLREALADSDDTVRTAAAGFLAQATP